MEFLIGMARFLLTMGTLAVMNLCLWHSLLPSHLFVLIIYSTPYLLISPAFMRRTEVIS
jgi:hypothetical protein